MKGAYKSLAIQTVIGGVIMYCVMFVMIDQLSSFYNNLNTFYMTLMMVAPMTAIMILGMKDMFPSKRVNGAILVASAALFFGAFGLIPSGRGTERLGFGVAAAGAGSAPARGCGAVVFCCATSTPVASTIAPTPANVLVITLIQ